MKEQKDVLLPAIQLLIWLGKFSVLIFNSLDDTVNITKPQ